MPVSGCVGSWYADAVCWAAASKLRLVCPEAANPSRTLTQEQMLSAALPRTQLQKAGYCDHIRADGPRRRASVSSWAKDAMAGRLAQA